MTADGPVRSGWDAFGDDNPVTFARGRQLDRTYLSRGFRLALRNSKDFRQPARYVYKVFDEPDGDLDSNGLEWTEHVMDLTPTGRVQLTLQVAREAGQVRELILERVSNSRDATKLERLLRLDRDGATRLLDLLRALERFPVDEASASVRLDDSTLRAIANDPAALAELYESDPHRLRKLIEADASAEDVVALAHRRAAVARFRELLENADASAEAQADAGGPEALWQRFLEEEPWILGSGLAGTLFTSWSDDRLEQTVAGYSVAGKGKRADALLRTNGRIRSLVFAEIKHHQSPLLHGQEYRSACWAPSSELVGGVTQVQQTVEAATRAIGARLADLDADGFETGEHTYLTRPRSFLVIGHLSQLRSDAGVHVSKNQSFELYRRNVREPEIITFDELLARAEWQVSMGGEQP